MKEVKNLILVVVAAAFFIVLFAVSRDYAGQVKEENAGSINKSVIGQYGESGSKNGTAQDVQVENLIENMVGESISSDISVIVTGDILMQDEQFNSAYDEDDDSFDFTPWFKYMGDIYSGADYTAGVLKTTFAGKNNGAAVNYGGYGISNNKSNTPEDLAETLKDYGFDMLADATNHSLDCGTDGLFSTISVLDKYGLSHIGTAAAKDDVTVSVQTIDKIKVGFVSYTNSSNVDIPTGYEYVLDCLDNYSAAGIKELTQDIQSLKSDSGADLVIAFINFGSVHSDKIEDDQRSLAQKAAEAGADVIVGTGSTTVKPMEILTVDTGNGSSRSCLVFYGMGAILSSETCSSTLDEGADADIGAAIELNISLRSNGKAYVSSFRFIPVYLAWVDGVLTPVPLSTAVNTGDYLSFLSDNDVVRINKVNGTILSRFTGDTGLEYSVSGSGYLYYMP
ncbi:MAG: CapA family protein [Lachnospiraceae bacterium]|nr:CapA family protein [Lachnospiraceae bacterium]